MLDTIPAACNAASDRVTRHSCKDNRAFLRLILALLCLGVCALANQSVQAQQPEASTTSGTTDERRPRPTPR